MRYGKAETGDRIGCVYNDGCADTHCGPHSRLARTHCCVPAHDNKIRTWKHCSDKQGKTNR